ncbi:azurin [Basilea psittacipulmonis]|uniref:Azurin n=1 Tax=Basilea psittacipulmonis DSM 24701 TaxID=1072685 RepID=A0A077DFN9_9BURK|nr:azurin [Basilea psittacipulmonis]AIL32167.1 azurin [Basilea psittacipulmonis DSM 24701]
MMKKLLVVSAMALASATAFADCSVTVEANDAMQFNTKEINVSKTCKDFTVTLKHVGSLPKAAMGHDLVITSAADMSGVDADGIAAGLDNDYVKPGDERVVAHTKLIGGGETDSVTFPVSKLQAGTDYVFFCSFPGHSAMMKGVVKLVD